MIICKPRTVACSICEKAFTTTHSMGKYCSAECARVGQRASWREYGGRNKEHRHSYQKSHYRKNRPKILARTKAYTRTERGKEVRRKIDLKQRETNPQKVNARTAVMVALRKGQLQKKPCEECGVQKTQAHHTDYSKPLDVTWLCQRCHDLRHGKNAAIVIEDGEIK